MGVEIKNLSHVYMKGTPYEKTALKGINLFIEQGEFIGIIGHTGSGKSTFIQHLNGLLKPTAGKVIINGTDTMGNGIKELREQVGVVFQYPEHQLFEETVFKDIAFGLVNMKVQSEEIDQRVKYALHAVGLSETLLVKSPFDLSGGQKRRAAIAGVLAMKPQILVLDEPAAGLDSKGKSDIYAFIKRLHIEEKLTIILVSHNMEDIVKLADRVIVMNKGEIALDGKTREVFSKVEVLENIGLDIPQITRFMLNLKNIIPDIKTDILTVQEAKEELMRKLTGISRFYDNR